MGPIKVNRMTSNISYFLPSMNNKNVSCTVHKLVVRQGIILTIK